MFGSRALTKPLVDSYVVKLVEVGKPIIHSYNVG
jgi:hypothetical protein